MPEPERPERERRRGHGAGTDLERKNKKLLIFVGSRIHYFFPPKAVKKN
jgi:hypothetical protein